MGRIHAIIPTFNPDPALLRGAVESCLASPRIVRITVVDDGSPSAVSLPAGERTEVLRQENAGPSAARNRALGRVESEHALLLDHDDELIAAGLEAMVSLAERTSAGVVVAARFEERAGQRRLKEVPAGWRDAVLTNPGEVFRPLAVFGASGCLISAGVIRAGVRFDENLWIGEDRDFLRRAADVAPIAVCSTPGLVVRLHDGGENLSSLARLDRRVRDHITILERHTDDSSRGPLREQTMWLLSALAKRRPFDGGSWRRLSAAARGRGWPIPIKARWRAWRAQRAAGVAHA